MTDILEGVLILDLSRYIAGPFGSTLLADMGAEVIRVENCGGEEDRKLGPMISADDSTMFAAINRNKKGITLNLRSPKGQEILRKLVARSDVLLENFSPQAKEMLNLTYPELKKVNPSLIVVSVSGFGLYGPLTHRVCFDSVAQAMSGLISITGPADGDPVKNGISVVDYCTSLYAALGIMLALYHREKTGIGQAIDLSLFDVAVALMTGYGFLAEYKLWDRIHSPAGLHPFYTYGNGFPAKDGWIFISVASNPIWKRLCKVIGREDFISDHRFQSDYERFENRYAIDPIVEEWVSHRTVEEASKLLDEARVPYAPINTVADLFTNPQVKARDSFISIEQGDIKEFPVPGITLKFSETPGGIKRAAPSIGGDNEAVYGKLLGLGLEELNLLKEEGVI